MSFIVMCPERFRDGSRDGAVFMITDTRGALIEYSEEKLLISHEASDKPYMDNHERLFSGLEWEQFREAELSHVGKSC